MIFMDRIKDRKSESGINMIDLMMWLVIAALLLAAAIQGIGYYHRAATLANMKSDAAGAATNVISAASMDQGVVDLPTVNTGVSNSKWTTGVTHTVEAPAVSGKKPFIRVSSPDVTGSDVVYLFDSCGGYDVGVNIIPKNSSPALLACGIDLSGAQPVTDGSAVMNAVWDTSLPGCSTITLPLNGAINSTIDWGDGTKTTTTTANPTHTYSGAPGPVLVKITGTFSRWVNINPTNATCIARVTGWGNTGTTDLSWGFNGAKNLTAVAQIPTGVTSLIGTFYNAAIFNGDITNWDTANVTTMQQMFYGDAAFNQNIGNWNTAKVTKMGSMFNWAKAFNQNIGNWDTSNVTNMSMLFNADAAFNQNIGNWNTTKVTDMSYVFGGSAFNQNIGNWDTSNVTTMSGMFGGSAFNQNIGNWNTAKVTNMGAMFTNTSTFNQNISGWNTANVTDMHFMFWGDSAFNQNIGNWNTAKVTDMRIMFYLATSFNQNISGWNTANVTDMTQMFYGNTAFRQDISGWNVAAVTTFSGFYTGSGIPVSYIPPKFR